MEQGLFITLEGIDGVGKSTHVETVRTALEERGHSVVTTREPGGTPLGQKVREVLLSEEASGSSPETDMLLMQAARADHVARFIRPHLEAGYTVVCDRFQDSTYAYQGHAGDCHLGTIGEIERTTLGGLAPDCTILLDASVETALARSKIRGELDRFESEGSRYFRDAAEMFRVRARMEPDRFSVIDADQSLEAVERKVRAVATLLPAPAASARPAVAG